MFKCSYVVCCLLLSVAVVWAPGSPLEKQEKRHLHAPEGGHMLDEHDEEPIFGTFRNKGVRGKEGVLSPWDQRFQQGEPSVPVQSNYLADLNSQHVPLEESLYVPHSSNDEDGNKHSAMSPILEGSNTPTNPQGKEEYLKALAVSFSEFTKLFARLVEILQHWSTPPVYDTLQTVLPAASSQNPFSARRRVEVNPSQHLPASQTDNHQLLQPQPPSAGNDHSPVQKQRPPKPLPKPNHLPLSRSNHPPLPPKREKWSSNYSSSKKSIAHLLRTLNKVFQRVF